MKLPANIINLINILIEKTSNGEAQWIDWNSPNEFLLKLKGRSILVDNIIIENEETYIFCIVEGNDYKRCDATYRAERDDFTLLKKLHDLILSYLTMKKTDKTLSNKYGICFTDLGNVNNSIVNDIIGQVNVPGNIGRVPVFA